MRNALATTVALLLLGSLPLSAQAQTSVKQYAASNDRWTKELKDRSERGTLHDAFQKVRGDSGKWNENPSLQHSPPLSKKPPKMSLDEWSDRVNRTRRRALTSLEENWLLFETHQLDDNDRVWIERIEREGNLFRIVLSQAIWQGRYSKTFTYYSVFGVNLGKLPPGEYQAKWIILPLVFREFEGSGRPRDEQRRDEWSKDERPADKNPRTLSVHFMVTAPSP